MIRVDVGDWRLAEDADGDVVLEFVEEPPTPEHFQEFRKPMRIELCREELEELAAAAAAYLKLSGVGL